MFICFVVLVLPCSANASAEDLGVVANFVTVAKPHAAAVKATVLAFHQTNPADPLSNRRYRVVRQSITTSQFQKPKRYKVAP
eukprot:4342244-Amphidinium_carterae.1